MPTSLSSAHQLPRCDSYADPNAPHEYYYRYFYPPASNAIASPRSVVDALLDWILSRSPDAYTAPTAAEADCIVVRPRRTTATQSLLSRRLNYCILAFFVSLVLSTLYFRSIAKRRAPRRRRSTGRTAQQPASPLYAIWTAVYSALMSIWTFLQHGAQTTPKPRTIEVTIDQDTWLRRFTSVSSRSSASAKTAASVRLPPDWHDWFKRSPPRPLSPCTTPLSLSRTTQPSPSRPTTPSPLRPPPPSPLRPSPSGSSRPTPTPLSPSKTQRRAALRPKANRDWSNSSSGASSDEARLRLKLRPVARRPSALEEDALASSTGFVMVPSVTESVSLDELSSSALQPELAPRAVDQCSTPSEDEFDYELFRAACIPLPDIAEDLLPHLAEDQLALPVPLENAVNLPLEDADDASEPEPDADAPGAQKKKTRRSGRKWKRRRANAAAAAAAAALD